MDLNSLLDQHQRSLILYDSQFIRDYAVRIRMVRTELGAGDAVCGFPT